MANFSEFLGEKSFLSVSLAIQGFTFRFPGRHFEVELIKFERGRRRRSRMKRICSSGRPGGAEVEKFFSSPILSLRRFFSVRPFVVVSLAKKATAKAFSSFPASLYYNLTRMEIPLHQVAKM